MNILLWVLQAGLAFLYFAGGAYKVMQYDKIATQMGALGRGGTVAAGVIEMVGAVLLIVPAAMKWMPALTPLAAAALSVESLALSVMYARQSLELALTNPLVWSAVMTVLTAFVAYGR